MTSEEKDQIARIKDDLNSAVHFGVSLHLTPLEVRALLKALAPAAESQAASNERSTGICFFCGEPINGKHEKDCPQADHPTLTDEQRAQLELIVSCDTSVLLRHITEDTNYNATIIERMFGLSKERARSLLAAAENKTLPRESEGGEVQAVPPRWYSVDEIKHALKCMNYSDGIAIELSAWFTRHLQLAFNKGFEKGQRATVSGVVKGEAE